MNAFRVLLALMAGLAGAILVLPLVLLLAPCVFVLMVTRHLTRWIEPTCLLWQQLIEFDPFVGWKGKPNLNAYHLADDVYNFTTDAEGWRGSGTVAESQVLVFGDSYAFGHAVSDRHFFASVNPKLRVKAIGINGYNMVQQLMWMKRLAPEIVRKLIVWFVYLGNDLTDNLEASMEGYRIPFVRENRESGGWEIVTSHLSALPWPSGARNWISTFSERNTKIFMPGPTSERIFAACEFLIGEATTVVRQAGGKLVVVSVPNKPMLSPTGHEDWKDYFLDPSKFDIDFPDDQLAAICVRLGVPFVAGKAHLQLSDYRKFDTHWNEEGNRKVSELLDTLYRTSGLGLAPVSLKSPNLCSESQALPDEREVALQPVSTDTLLH
jgi:hypothetical protein